MTNTNPDIRGFQIGHNTYKIAAYADDLLFFLGKEESAPGVWFQKISSLFSYE